MTTRFKHVDLQAHEQKVCEDLQERYEQVEAALDTNLYESRELSIALTKLEESAMWANKALSKAGVRETA